MLCRTDRLCHRTRWGSPCPLDPQGRLDELLLAHLKGGSGPEARGVSRKKPEGWPVRGPWRLGTYCPAADGLTVFACIDCDGSGHSSPLADPLAAALAVVEALRRAGLPAYLERSKGGKGWHVWVFFAGPLPACIVRRVLFALLPADLPLAGGGFADARANVGVEVFPKQDRHDYMGNQVWLPGWHGAEWPNNQFHRRAEDGTLEPYVPSGFDVVNLDDLARLDPGEPPPRDRLTLTCPPPRAEPGDDEEGDGDPPPPSAEELVRLALRRAAPGSAHGRNATGFWLACQLRDNAVPRGEAARAMRDYARQAPAGDHPYTEEDALESLGQAWDSPRRRPWRRRCKRESGWPKSCYQESHKEEDALHEILGNTTKLLSLSPPPPGEACPAALAAAKPVLRNLAQPRAARAVCAPCRRWTCCVCYRRLVWDRGHHYARKILAHRGPVHALTLPAAGWKALKVRLSRARADYVRIDPGEGSYALLATATLPGAEELDALAAVGRLGEHLRALQRRPCAARGKPVLTSSKGWKPPPRKERTRAWERVCAVHVCEPGPVVELLRSKGIAATVRPLSEGAVWLVEWSFPPRMGSLEVALLFILLGELRDPGDGEDHEVPW
jgi:hypothetical protein